MLILTLQNTGQEKVHLMTYDVEIDLDKSENLIPLLMVFNDVLEAVDMAIKDGKLNFENVVKNFDKNTALVQLKNLQSNN